MKLYYAPGACSLADHIALIEAEMSFELERVDLKEKKTEHGEDYSTINPKGYVPALQLDDGEILTENIAILSFIAAQSGKLAPREGLAHCRVLETTAFISTELHKSFKPLLVPGSSADDQANAKQMLAKRFGFLEARLGDREFIVGEDITIADCYLFVMLMWAKEKAGLPMPQHLGAYYERLKQRPSIARALREEGLAKAWVTP
jgi:glutathione S-transferase